MPVVSLLLPYGQHSALKQSPVVEHPLMVTCLHYLCSDFPLAISSSATVVTIEIPKAPAQDGSPVVSTLEVGGGITPAARSG